MLSYKQHLKDDKTMFREVGGFDMAYEDFEEQYREAWEKNFN